jgi:hypothetical protein
MRSRPTTVARIAAAAGAAALAATGMAAGPALASGPERSRPHDQSRPPASRHDGSRHHEQAFTATLRPLNASGVRGSVRVEVERQGLEVHLTAHGLQAGFMHMQHIHGTGPAGNAVCPPPGLDPNHDGTLDVAEGAPFYGPVVVTLGHDVTKGRTLRYERTFTTTDAGAPVATMGDLDRYVVVVHGLDVNHDGKLTTIDPSGSRPFDEAFVPVACGVITVHR